MRGSYDSTYRRWLSAAPTKGYPINAIEIRHTSFKPIFLVANENLTDLRLRDEKQREILHTAANFALTIPNKDRSSETQAAARFVAMEGRLYQQLKRISPQAKDNPVTVTHRVYLSTRLNRPVFTPPPVFNLIQAKPNFETLDFILEAPSLPNLRMGEYYIPTLYPGLVEV